MGWDQGSAQAGSWPSPFAPPDPCPRLRSQQRSKSEMLSRKSFATGVPAVSMDELAAFADSYGAGARRADSSLDARPGNRFERAETRARGGLFGDGPPEDYSPERYFGVRSHSREAPADAERAWTPEDAPLPRLVSLPAACEHPSRGGSLETPARRGAPYYAWSPPATYRARAPHSDDDDAPDDALPPYSEHELSRAPSHRGRDLSGHGTSEKRRKKEPAKKQVGSHALPDQGHVQGLGGRTRGAERVAPRRQKGQGRSGAARFGQRGCQAGSPAPSTGRGVKGAGRCPSEEQEKARATPGSLATSFKHLASGIPAASAPQALGGFRRPARRCCARLCVHPAPAPG